MREKQVMVQSGLRRALMGVAAASALAFSATGVAHANYDIGLKAYEQGQYDVAVDIWTRFAVAGDVRSMKALGDVYSGAVLEDAKGAKIPLETGKKIDNVESLRWYSLAAYHRFNEGFQTPSAEERNAQILAEERLPEIRFRMSTADVSRGEKLVSDTFERGSPYDLYTLGDMYRRGTGVEKNNVKALTMYALAKARGVGAASIAFEELEALMTKKEVDNALETVVGWQPPLPEEHTGQTPQQKELERTRKELEADLRILICSGLPEGYPDDLLDIQWDDDHVTITQDLDLKRPVRFTVEEACALLTGLETLNGLPELAEGSALESVTLKLMAAAGEEGLKAAALSAPGVGPGNAAALETAREAIRTGAQLRLRYFSPLRDSVSERDIDPLRLYSLDNTWYLEAYCHSAQGLRNFRLDRIEALEPNGLPVSESAKPGDSFPVKLFTPNDDDAVVVVELTRRGTGLADEYYAERTAELPDGGMLAEIRFGSTDWLPMFVAQHGGTARIVQPEDLAAASRQWLSAALAQYED